MVSEFPINLFPVTLREVALSLSKFTRTPIEYAAITALAAQSASLGKSVSIDFQGRLCKPNLFMVVVGGSGTGKSSVFRPLLEPFYFKQKELQQKWKEEVQPKLLIEEERLTRKKKKLWEGSEDESESAASNVDIAETEKELAILRTKLKSNPRLICEDTTQEKLAEMLHTRSETIFLASADAVAVVDNILGKYSSGATDASIYLKMYTGDPIVVDRMTRGTIAIDSPCGTVLLFTTPDQSERIAENDSLLRGGLLSRACVLTVLVDDLPIPKIVAEAPTENIKFYQMHIEACISEYLLQPDKILVLELDEEQTEQVRHAINRNVTQIAGLPENIKPVLRRYPELLLKIVTCFHFGKEGPDAILHKIEAQTVSSAIAFADYLQSEHLKLFDEYKIKEREKHLKKSLQVFVALYKGNKLREIKVLPSNLTRSAGASRKIFQNAFDAEQLLETAAVGGFLSKTENGSGYSEYFVAENNFKTISDYLKPNVQKV